MSATASGGHITLTAKMPGANTNRVGVYGFVSGAQTEVWSPWFQQFRGGGVSPRTWRIHLNFGSLMDVKGRPVAMTSVRKIRWTYVPEWQDGPFEPTEFDVLVTNWTVKGTNATYSVAGPGSRRIEDDDPTVVYSGGWTGFKGAYNYSGGSAFQFGPMHLGEKLTDPSGLSVSRPHARERCRDCASSG